MPSPISEASRTVFLDYTQMELDAQYDQARWDPCRLEHIAAYTALTRAAQARLGPCQSLRYGDGPTDWLDLYPAAQRGAPIHVFVHGGAWRSLGRADSGFAAPMFVEAGAHFVALDFSLLPEIDLPGMVAQLRRAIVWLHANAREKFGGDPAQIHIGGHSSGAHLAACLLVTDWAAEHGAPADIIKSGVLVSGMYDLTPVRLSARNAYVKLTPETEVMLSPLHHLRRLACPVAVFRGDTESAEFSRQSDSIALVLRAAGRLARHEVVVGKSHFSVILDLADPASALARTALSLMGLRG